MITLTNGAQIPKNAVQLQTTAAIDGYYVTQPLRLVQYDETLPVAAVQLTCQNQPYTPPTGAELNVRMGKPDGTTVYNPCLGVDANGVVYFAFTLQMTIVAGTGTLTVEVTDSGVKNSAPIIAEIRPNPVPEGSIESADEFLTLQEILAEAEKWGQIVQANASNIQQVVDNLADIQNAAENAQAAAASAAAAQQAAQEALGFRKFYSAVVPDANGNLDPSRPMVVGPAASVEIESAGDRIQSVTALGFTQQAGTGDPSPTNVRQLTNGGMRYGVVVYDGSSDESYTVNGRAFIINPKPSDLVPLVGPDALSPLVCNRLPPKAASATWGGQQGVSQASAADGRVQVFVNGVTTAQGVREWLKQNPITVWYPLETGSLYAPIILQGGEYRATCLPLTAPLCEGDSVVSWVKSGCDVEVMIDGTENFLVDPASTFADVIRFSIQRSDANTSSPVVFSERFTPSTVFTLNSEYIGITDIGKLIGAVYKSRLSSQDAEGVKAYFAAHPLTVWYRSTNYTEADDIPVSLETHVRWRSDLSSKLTVYYNADKSVQAVLQNAPAPKDTGATALCSIAKYKESLTGDGFYLSKSPMSVFFGGAFTQSAGWSNVSDAKAFFDANEVSVVYQLATPITYAHEAVVLEAATGDQLTYTVTGQSGGTASVALKPFQDGGHAATADNAANAQNAVNAQTANNSQQLGGLTLAALQNLLVPVGYIFSWAPVDDGPDLSTPAKVAAYFGFGTWQAYGTGQVLVGVDSGQTEFATVGKTGGEKTHTLTIAELAKHSHRMYWSNEGGAGTGNGVLVRDALTGGPWPYGYYTETDGNSQPHNNLQPYVVVYRWQRVA